MSTNAIVPPTNLATLPVPAGTDSGDPVIVGGIQIRGYLGGRLSTFSGVCMTSPSGVVGVRFGQTSTPEGYAMVALDGTYRLKVPEAVEEVGAPIYINPADNTLTIDDGGGTNKLFGHTVPALVGGVPSGATKPADSGGVHGTVNVRLFDTTVRRPHRYRSSSETVLGNG